MSGINNATSCSNRISVANEKAEPIIWELVKKELIVFANLNNEERELKVEELTEKFPIWLLILITIILIRVVYRNNYLKPIQWLLWLMNQY